MNNKHSKNLADYYSKRAKEYEAIYHRPNTVRLQEQNFIAEYIRKSMKGRYVLELACGTGYWTKYLLGIAKKIQATDISPQMLEIASKRYSYHSSIQFLLADAYDPPKSIPPFTGVMANFWLSHIPKRKISSFLKTLHSRVMRNAFILFVDNVFQRDIGGTLIRKKDQVDTWKKRQLENGEKYTILKNYYAKKQLRAIFSPFTKKLGVCYFKHFWLVGYQYNK